MSRCTVKMMEERANAIPRSCAQCGLGPCPLYSKARAQAIRHAWSVSFGNGTSQPPFIGGVDAPDEDARPDVADLEKVYGHPPCAHLAAVTVTPFGNVPRLPDVLRDPPPMPPCKPALQPVSLSDVDGDARTVGELVRAHIAMHVSRWLGNEGEDLDWCDARNVDALVDVMLKAQREALTP